MSAGPPGGRVPAREVVVDERHAGQRIDNFLSARLKGLPRARIYRILRRGEVRVNRGRIRQQYRLKAGDVVRIPPVRLAGGDQRPSVPESIVDAVEHWVLYEDVGLLVLDKPSGVAVHGGSGRSYGVIEALRAARAHSRYLELVHRLDKETSGCLLVAKKRSVLTTLHTAFRAGRVDKRYRLLVQGRWSGGKRRVEGALKKNVLSSGERFVRMDETGKSACTSFIPGARSDIASLVTAQPRTGRTHQIRVHAAALGHPIAGDAKYGDRAFNARLREAGLRRLFLHAAELRLTNPTTGDPQVLRADLPPELEAVLEELALSGRA